MPCSGVLTLAQHATISEKIFDLGGYKKVVGSKVTHAARVFAARHGQQCGLSDKVGCLEVLALR